MDRTEMILFLVLAGFMFLMELLLFVLLLLLKSMVDSLIELTRLLGSRLTRLEEEYKNWYELDNQ